MAAEIVKVYKEHLPAVRLIGKCYSDSDSNEFGSFSNKWGEWFGNGWFGDLEKLNSIPENGDAYVGAMREANGRFEYWIGMFFPVETSVPEGYESVEIEESDIAVCWIYGRDDNGEIYGMEPHSMSMQMIAEQGWVPKDDAWYLERYNCPRFTSPDEHGKVILDYCVYIK